MGAAHILGAFRFPVQMTPGYTPGLGSWETLSCASNRSLPVSISSSF